MKKNSIVQVGQRVKVSGLNNLIAEIIEISPLRLFVVIQDESGNKWPLAINSLSALNN